jgi:hypothetical protein
MRAARFAIRHGFDALVVAVAVVVQIEVWALPVPGPKLLVVPGMLLATLPLLLRRRFPFAAPVCVFGALAAMTFADPESTAGSPTLAAAVFLAFWSVGAHAEPRQGRGLPGVYQRSTKVKCSEKTASFAALFFTTRVGERSPRFVPSSPLQSPPVASSPLESRLTP